MSVSLHPILPMCYTCELLPPCYWTFVAVTLSFWLSLWQSNYPATRRINDFFKVEARFTFMPGLWTYWNPRNPTTVLVSSPKRHLLLWNVGCRRLAEGQVKWQARGLAAHNGEGDHRPWVGVHSGLVVCDGVCDTGLPQTEVLAPARSFFGTGQPSLFSWWFVQWGRSCCHYSEHKRNTWIF
jgi:hypothetical protein